MIGLGVETAQEITYQQRGGLSLHLREEIHQLDTGFGAGEGNLLLQNPFLLVANAQGQFIGDIVEGQAVATNQ